MAGQFGDWAIVGADGAPLLDFTSMISLEIQSEGRVVSEPVERGGFASYNKVASPLFIRAQVGVRGNPSELQTFLEQLEALKRSTATFSLVTGEQEYKSLNLESYDYARRREDGVGSLYAELQIVEIQEVAPQYVELPAEQCRNPEDASRIDTGKTQAGESAINAIWNRLSGKGEGDS